MFTASIRLETSSRTKTFSRCLRTVPSSDGPERNLFVKESLQLGEVRAGQPQEVLLTVREDGSAVAEEQRAAVELTERRHEGDELVNRTGRAGIGLAGHPRVAVDRRQGTASVGPEQGVVRDVLDLYGVLVTLA